VVQARRAKVRPARVIIPLAVAAALLVGGSFAAWKFWPTATTADPLAQSSTTAAESEAPSTAVSTPSSSTDASNSAQPASAASKKALKTCQQKISAADDVLKAGRIGVRHWAAHVRAQADNFDGKISITDMKGQFKATRLKGPGDLKRYDEALAAYEDIKGSCGKVADADSVVAASLAKCQKRSKAQKPVMAATADGMRDWKNHQKLMQANKDHQAGSPSQAQEAWLKQYHNAFKNIDEFKKATAEFKAPAC
jgi:hypothetical protein